MISKGFFFKIAESRVTDWIQGSISKNLQEGFVINCNYKMDTSRNKKYLALSKASATTRASPLIGAYLDSVG